LRRLLTVLFATLILGEIAVSPILCLQCCSSQEQGGQDHEACSPWCVGCTCCHSTQTVSPETPQPLVALGAVQVIAPEVSVPLPASPPRDILHVPLA
jgi:hypothetical protein